MTRLMPVLTRLGSLGAIVLLSLPSATLAGGKATISTNQQPVQPGQSTPTDKTSETTTITWRDAETLRMDIGDDTDYMLVRDGKMYMVSESEGEINVMDLSGMSAMVQAMASSGINDDNPFGSIESIEATGATANVAGIAGQVYRITSINANSSPETVDAVLTDDPLVIEMTQAYLTSITAMAGPALTQAFESSLPDDNRGLLSMEDQFRIDSINRSDPPAATFELPAEPVGLEGLLEGITIE